jgi:hypothetical protein
MAKHLLFVEGDQEGYGITDFSKAKGRKQRLILIAVAVRPWFWQTHPVLLIS